MSMGLAGTAQQRNAMVSELERDYGAKGTNPSLTQLVNTYGTTGAGAFKSFYGPVGVGRVAFVIAWAASFVDTNGTTYAQIFDGGSNYFSITRQFFQGGVAIAPVIVPSGYYLGVSGGAGNNSMLTTIQILEEDI